MNCLSNRRPVSIEEFCVPHQLPGFAALHLKEINVLWS